MKSREYAKVIGQEKIAPDICSLRIEAPQIAAEAKAGQFLSLYSADKSRMLPRPISICEIDPDQGYIRLVYRVVGAGTEEFSGLCEGDRIQVLGPLGNGFPLKEGKAFLIGGGIGIPPMVQTAKELSVIEDNSSIQIIAGYRSE